jgi:hypothetical protein
MQSCDGLDLRMQVPWMANFGEGISGTAGFLPAETGLNFWVDDIP